VIERSGTRGNKQQELVVVIEHMILVDGIVSRHGKETKQGAQRIYPEARKAKHNKREFVHTVQLH